MELGGRLRSETVRSFTLAAQIGPSELVQTSRAGLRRRAERLGTPPVALLRSRVTHEHDHLCALAVLPPGA